MKSSVVSTTSPTKKDEDAICFYRYLKPGALARIRDSKFSAKNRKKTSLLHKAAAALKLNESSSSQMTVMTQMPMESVPSFPAAATIGQLSRCGVRKKLFAVAPTFADEIHDQLS